MCLLALAGQYKPPTRLPFWGLPSVIRRHCKTAEQGSSLASRRACHSFTQAHRRVSKVKQKTHFPGKGTGVGCHFLIQGIFPTRRLNPGLPHYRQTLYALSHQRSPIYLKPKLFVNYISIKKKGI